MTINNFFCILVLVKEKQNNNIMNSQEYQIEKAIEKLVKRREAASYQRKITTDLGKVIEYDDEISAIDNRLKHLRIKLMMKESS